MVSDKDIEKRRYNNASIETLKQIESIDLNLYGSKSAKIYYSDPYSRYEQLIQFYVNESSEVLDLCIGDGVNTIFTAKLGCKVTATDIANEGLNVAKIRASYFKLDNIKFLCADAENLNFSDDSFDVITIVGSLSYLDLDKFIREVKRVLKPGGRLVVLDSFNHNLFYKINRYLHYFAGNRTYGTLIRMPSCGTLKKLNNNFKNPHVEYFGIFSFLIPAFKLFLNDSDIHDLIKKLDKKFLIFKKYSFKIIYTAENF
jgi:ubiquinone/menaquinone biosynthesis C-methylase UbiE